jgi:hypothetical protein
MSEAFANISFGNGEGIKASADNTVVYSHKGEAEMYDHVFIEVNDKQGVYIWAQVPPDNQQFLDLAAAAVESGAEVHLNIQNVSNNDIQAFGRAALRDLNEIPDWLPEV